MKNKVLRNGAFTCLPSLLLVACVVKASPVTKPNIIYILADDMGIGDVHALNAASQIPTPALDQMIANGMSFTDAHSNSAVSTPTRYGTLTGRYAFRSALKKGVLTGYSEPLLEPGRETVASFLKANGYRTACIGKWHLGLNWSRKDNSKVLYEGTEWDVTDTQNVNYEAAITGGPTDCGFDYSYILPASLDMAPYVYVENGKLTAPVKRHVETWKSDEAHGMWYRHGDIADDFSHETCLQRFTRQSVKYIREAGKDKSPFFLYFPLTAPHTPWLPSAEFRHRSNAGVYGDFVCMVDDVVRQIYKALEESGQAENTIVVFTSDNGSMWSKADIAEFNHCANGVYAGAKSDIWEGGHRIPYIVTWPHKIQAGSQSAQLVCSTDLLATCAEMLKTPLGSNAGEDSYSFWKILTGESTDRSHLRESLISHSVDGYFAFRQGPWVLLDCKGSGGWALPEKESADRPAIQLYNLEEDVKQQNNVAMHHPNIVKVMKLRLEEQKAQGRSR